MYHVGCDIAQMGGYWLLAMEPQVHSWVTAYEIHSGIGAGISHVFLCY